MMSTKISYPMISTNIFNRSRVHKTATVQLTTSNANMTYIIKIGSPPFPARKLMISTETIDMDRFVRIKIYG